MKRKIPAQLVPLLLALLTFVFSLHFLFPRGLMTVEILATDQNGLLAKELRFNEIGFKTYRWSNLVWTQVQNEDSETSPKTENLGTKRRVERIPVGWHADTLRLRGNLPNELPGIEKIWLRSSLGDYQIDFGSDQIQILIGDSKNLEIHAGKVFNGRLLAENGQFDLEIKGLWLLFLAHNIKPYSSIFFCLVFAFFGFYFALQCAKGKVSKGLSPCVIFWAAFLQLHSDPIALDLNSPTDLISNLPAFERNSQGVVYEHPEHTDSLDSYLPKWILMKGEIWNGRVPTVFWNRAGGEAGIWSPINGAYGPFFWTFAAIPSNALGFYAAMLLKLFLLGSGFYFFARCHLTKVGALFGATTFMFCGFNVAWLYVPAVSNLVWVAWSLGFLSRLASNPRVIYFLGLVASFCLLLCGGFPMIAVFGSLTFVIYTLSLVFSKSFTPPVFKILGLICLAALLSVMVCVFPLSNLWIQLSQVDLGYRANAGSDFVWQDLRSFFPMSDHFGQVARKETLIYSGAMATVSTIVLFFLFIFKRKSFGKKEHFFAIFSMVTFSMAFLIVFNLIPKSLMYYVPFFATNPWGRMASVVGLAMCIATGIVVDQVFLTVKKIFGVSLAVVFICGLYLVNQNDLRKQFRNINGTAPAALFYPKLPAIDFLSKQASLLDAVFADNSWGINGFLSAYGFSEWCAHGFITNPVKRLIALGARDAFASNTSCNIEAANIDFDSDVFSILSTKYLILSQRKIDQDPRASLKLKNSKKWERVFWDGDTSVYQNKLYAGPGFWTLAGSDHGVRMSLKMESNWKRSGSGLSAALDLTNLKDGYVVLPFSFQPHLQVYWNGAQVELTSFQGAFPMFKADGKGFLQVDYFPKIWKWSSILSVLGLIFTFLVAVRLKRIEAFSRA
jgi:hypothetical protein